MAPLEEGRRETDGGDLMLSCSLTKTKWGFYLLFLGRGEFMSGELRFVGNISVLLAPRAS